MSFGLGIVSGSKAQLLKLVRRRPQNSESEIAIKVHPPVRPSPHSGSRLFSEVRAGVVILGTHRIEVPCLCPGVHRVFVLQHLSHKSNQCRFRHSLRESSKQIVQHQEISKWVVCYTFSYAAAIIANAVPRLP